MGMFFGKRELTLGTAWDTRIRPYRAGVLGATRDQSLRASVKWACLRLRADLISTTPLDVFRRINGVQVEVGKPLVLRSPGGASMEPEEWLYSTQMDLDDVGNTFGQVVAWDGRGLPMEIELVPVESVSVIIRKGVKEVRVDGKKVDSASVWHERQFTTSGSPVGLSPTAYAALTLSGYLSAQQFAADWFAGSAMPAAHFRNTAKVLKPGEAPAIKAQYAESVANGGVLVTGSDWEYHMLGAKASESQFVEAQKVSAPDQCRFYGVPGDMVDVEVASGTITYANVTQRNLQLLVINLGPAFTRRERKFSARLLPAPQYAKFATDALMRMDPAGRYAMHGVGITARFLAPSEARELENRAPFTPEQLAEFERLFPTRALAAPTKETPK
jgi:HK97 family phage portal protein